MRYSQCGPGLEIALGDDDSAGAMGIGWSCGTGANKGDVVIRMVDNGSRWPWPMAAYSHSFVVWPWWFAFPQVIESFPPDGVQVRTLDSILENAGVSRVHIHWLPVPRLSMERARAFAEMMVGHGYSWAWCVRWFGWHRYPWLFPHPGDMDGEVVCSVLVRRVFASALVELPWTPNDQYFALYGRQSYVNQGLPDCPNLVVEWR